jgi:putative AdoMet-dependent methyltransferase
MGKYNFQYNEYKQAGADHSVVERAKAYDSKMEMFRDYKKEASMIKELLCIQPNHRLLDIGAGTGALSLELASYCKEIVAIDISTEMLSILEEKAINRNIPNIKTIKAGFLTYQGELESFDCIISNAVLHHLPDFWKLVALKNVRKYLKRTGMFLLSDVILSFTPDNYEDEINAFLTNLEKQTDDEFVKDGVLHFKEEFSTYDWILDLMIERAGFKIKDKMRKDNFQISYILTRLL